MLAARRSEKGQGERVRLWLRQPRLWVKCELLVRRGERGEDLGASIEASCVRADEMPMRTNNS